MGLDLKLNDWVQIGSFILKAATKILENSGLVETLLESDELDASTKAKIKTLRDAAKKEWDSLAPKE